MLGSKKLYKITLDQALRCINEVIISSDKNLEKELKCYSVEQHRRSPELSRDQSTMAELMLELIGRYELHQSTIVLLQPTSPLRRDEDISKCIKTFKNNNFDLVFTVSSQDKTVLKSGFVRGNKFIPIAEPEFTSMNRQDLPELFKPNGAVYVFNGGWFEENNGFTSNNVGVVEMPTENGLDIDNQEDFDRVAQIYKKHLKN
tara:strand:- start:671 stop:1276 length:606 start_codon:yes stop_codon:yes gene_type:complete